ncbi:MAG: EAL domain-containing protein [Pseudomonadales bacterium]|nr:EAL domain-containing protein [Pseudomonadales bacterium]MCP5331245.1 EAL domain-containing protein [Pseudomonadales bacterium]MCP5344904.1 EAL domain-containing protein [Pseudomonadales bacterium]
MNTPKRIRTDRKATLVLSALVLIAAIAAVAINTWFSYRGVVEQNANLSLMSDMLSSALMLVTVALSAYMLFRQRRALDERRFQAITDNARQITVIFNPDGTHRYASRALKLLLNVDSRPDIKPADYLHPDDLPLVLETIGEVSGSHSHLSLDSVRCLRHDGSWRIMQAEFIDMTEVAGVNGIVASLRDVTEQREAEESMRILSSAVEQSHGAVMITNDLGIVQYVNPRYTQITGYSREELVGTVARMLEYSDAVDEQQRGMRECIRTGQSWTVSMRSTRKNGELFWQALSASPVLDEHQKLTHIVISIEDTSQQRAIHAQMEQLAFYDPLTGLENRRLFKDRLEHSIKQVRRSKRIMALLFIDLDGFKNVNDTLGHEAGDELLVVVAGRLKECVREEDIVARLGGDEFTIILSNLRDNEAAGTVAAKIIKALQVPIPLAGQEVTISGSIGISVAPEDTMDATEMMRNADMAMYRAKTLGRNNSQFYTEDMNAANQARNSLENSLRAAVEEKSFVVYFQPQVDISAHRISGFEALVRWQQPEGDLLPERFISVAEESGLIVEIGEIVLRKACEQMQVLREAGFTEQKVSVNLSERQFRDPRLVSRVKAILDETGFDASGLQFEITEGMLMTQVDKSIATMCSLKELGVSIAIDNFGTGFSSLTNLARLPVDTLKVDRSFINRLSSHDDAGITSAVIALAQHMNLTVAAEGVENAEQEAFLRDHHCALQQGFLFCAPVAVADLIPQLDALQKQLQELSQGQALSSSRKPVSH